MPDLPRRPLGSSGRDVSVFSLGSWRTFERIPRERGVEVMREARDVGINFLDDARYDDETGSAPIASGYSEVVFGELYRATGWERDDVVVANKLWWEFWPDQTAAQELDGSLGRMGLDHVDLVYAMTPPGDLPVGEVVSQVSGLIESGRARSWGVANWTGELLAAAVRQADEQGVDPPCAAQLPYSLVQRQMVDEPVMAGLLEPTGVGLVASYVLAGGTLTGKYLRGGTGRATDDDDPVLRAGREAARPLSDLAAKWGVSPAHLALCFALSHPQLSSVLFGATTAAQVADNVASLGLFDTLDPAQVATLSEIGSVR